MEEQFLQAYEEYADAIFRHCAMRISDRERGKELMQETFLKAWESVRRGT
jgi:DNA-directed RNA polymerase specialized sigma24 family protein